LATHATKEFDPTDFEAFLKLLPKEVEGARCVTSSKFARQLPLPDFIALARSMESPSRSPATPLIRKSRIDAPFVYAA